MVLRELVVSSQLNLQPESDQAFLSGYERGDLRGEAGRVFLSLCSLYFLPLSSPFPPETPDLTQATEPPARMSRGFFLSGLCQFLYKSSMVLTTNSPHFSSGIVERAKRERT